VRVLGRRTFVMVAAAAFAMLCVAGVFVRSGMVRCHFESRLLYP
jgi:hypothetical protein